MSLFLQFALVVLGVICVLRGADRMTEGAVSMARRLHVSEMVIGLTIVAAGTSAPELFVSFVSALNGTPDMAVGNVVGSNTMNAMLIVGVAAMVAPMTISPTTVRKDIPFAVVASLLLLTLCLDGKTSLNINGNSINRLDGVLLLVGFGLFMAYTFKTAKNGVEPEAQTPQTTEPLWRSVFFLLFGLALLIVGANVFVNAASQIARQLGISDGIIGLTIVAGGTSLPELATSVVAARKGQSSIAIGNVIGSCVFNILLILGFTAVISPMQIEGITFVDLAIMLVSVVLVWVFSATKLTVARWEGGLLSLGYLCYLVLLLSQL